ncbi:hypothetical protein N7452_004027 [Penicillium brevicompactum]|uniref:BTB domain-containing protein n=1 Tax=Penicillium brevicompactum TaxID=5074 RepID=A0A9W9QXQ3_PENBR|nr:hypothetical protein N7452_004027 [Penicillium brevicompactum]
MTNEPEASAEHFVANILPLYYGPSVKIQVQPSNKEFIISKELLCTESSVFSKMFNGEFLESQQQTVTLEETEDDTSVRSLEALIQWLYHRTVRFDIKESTMHISATMELTRLADKYDIIGLEKTMAQYIRDILKCNPHPKSFKCARNIDHNTYHLTHDHIASANLLPRKHLVRRVLAAASVEGFLRGPNHKFSEEILDYPSFGADLLQGIRAVLNNKESLLAYDFEDPISGERSKLNPKVNWWLDSDDLPLPRR